MGTHWPYQQTDKGLSSLEKAFIQYLRSLSQIGISELPAGNELVQSRLQESIAATGELESSDDLSAKDETGDESSSRVAAVADSAPAAELVKESGDSLDESKVSRLQIVNDRVRNCFQCPELVDNRTQTVFGVGSPDARLCFLGEAPGADEDVQGEPFVGAAGKLLDRIIVACQMSRDEVYILNTIKCRPPNNRNPADQECANCQSFLDEQLSIIQPEFICCLGGIAAKHLLDSNLSVGRLRGKLHLYNGIKVVVTYHPAYLLRNPDAKRPVWDDMKFLMREMGIEQA